MLYAGSNTGFSPQALASAEGTMTFPLGQNPQKLAPLVAAAQQHRALNQTITWGQPGDVETFRALPLTGRTDNVLGVLLVGSSGQELAALDRRIRLVALQIAASKCADFDVVAFEGRRQPVGVLTDGEETN